MIILLNICLQVSFSSMIFYTVVSITTLTCDLSLCKFYFSIADIAQWAARSVVAWVRLIYFLIGLILRHLSGCHRNPCSFHPSVFMWVFMAVVWQGGGTHIAEINISPYLGKKQNSINCNDEAIPVHDNVILQVQ